jgi:hypothetical protein
MLDTLPNEEYDPLFLGQELETTYFDTRDFSLRRARRKGGRYITLRIRRYGANGTAPLFAFSAKTPDEKWRVEIAADEAALILAAGDAIRAALPPRLGSLLDGIAPGPLLPVVKACCRRYAVEEERDRLTLDVGVRTDLGKCLPWAVVEFKSIDKGAAIPKALAPLMLRPVKLSKFLWATEP